jgi:gamma-glutamyl hydrolase
VNTLKLFSPSYLFDDMSTQLRYRLSFGTGLLYFSHNFAVLANYTVSNQKFKEFWNVVSTTTSSYNEEFISAAESSKGPFFGSQFHPEKNLFEWKVKADRSDNGA